MFTRWAIQINKSWSSNPEYVTGSKKKITQMYEDVRRSPEHFRQTAQLQDKLQGLPNLTVSEGRFGYIPGSGIPITVVFNYTYSGSIQSPSGGFGFLKKAVVAALLLFVAWVVLTGMTLVHTERGVNLVEDLSAACYVTMEQGRPRTINVFGETLWYDRDGQIIIPDQREISHINAQRFENPTKYCSVVSLDN